MIKALFFILITANTAIAQKHAPVKPLFFVGGYELKMVDTFNRYILSVLHEYHPVAFDSTGKKQWGFSYANKTQDRLELTYKIEQAGGNADLKVPSKQTIGDMIISGHFLDMQHLYNEMFSDSMSVNELKGNRGVHTGLLYNGNNKRYWLVFEPTIPTGYWWLRLRQL